MTTVTIVIQNAPYNENNNAWHALRFAGAALAENLRVRVHLLDDGVQVGYRGQPVPEGAIDPGALLAEPIDGGLELRTCGMALDDCAIDPLAMLPGIGRGSMKALANGVKDSDHLVAF